MMINNNINNNMMMNNNFNNNINNNMMMNNNFNNFNNINNDIMINNNMNNPMQFNIWNNNMNMNNFNFNNNINNNFINNMNIMILINMNPFNNIDNIFPKNKIGTIEKYIELLKINENYFILTSTKLKKSINKHISNYFYLSLYNFNFFEEVTKIEVDVIENNNERNDNIIYNVFKIEKDNQIDNKFKIKIEYNNITRNYDFIFEDGQFIKVN